MRAYYYDPINRGHLVSLSITPGEHRSVSSEIDIAEKSENIDSSSPDELVYRDCSSVDHIVVTLDPTKTKIPKDLVHSCWITIVGKSYVCETTSVLYDYMRAIESRDVSIDSLCNKIIYQDCYLYSCLLEQLYYNCREATRVPVKTPDHFIFVKHFTELASNENLSMFISKKANIMTKYNKYEMKSIVREESRAHRRNLANRDSGDGIGNNGSLLTSTNPTTASYKNLKFKYSFSKAKDSSLVTGERTSVPTARSIGRGDRLSKQQRIRDC